ncbi:MAG: aminotransferase class V-fold PLP-dependent enzyme [Oligoflexales bacterium]
MALLNLSDFQKPDNPIAKFYSKFYVSKNILLTGHSHQAWPDCSLRGQIEAWNDAACLKDEKWEKAFQIADEVKKKFAQLINDKEGLYTLGESVHHLLCRLLSCYSRDSQKLKIITTGGEFHSARRQLNRLSEVGVDIHWIPIDPFSSFVERFLEAIDSQTSIVLLSKVLFESGRVIQRMDEVADRCLKKQADLVVDIYHALNVIDFDLKKEGLQHAYLLGGGYKYLQLGEGNCFLRRPSSCDKKPLLTGWFSEISRIGQSRKEGEPVFYPEGASRFDGSTYDVTSHYRAKSVFDFFIEHSLSPALLSQVNMWQKKTMLEEFYTSNFSSKVLSFDEKLEGVGGFLSFKTPYAKEISSQLKKEYIFTDYRGDYLRLGPAPYLSEQQLRKGVDCMKKAALKV